VRNRRKAFIIDKYGIQIFKKILKVLIHEHQKIEMIEVGKRFEERRKKMENDNIMYKKTTKKQVRMIGDYLSESDDNLAEDLESDIDTDRKLSKNRSEKNSEMSKKETLTPKSKRDEIASEKDSKKEELSSKSSKKDGSPNSRHVSEVKSPTLMN
jgi:hypothetical protein